MKKELTNLTLNKDILNTDPFAYEGERKLEIHKKIERDRNLRNKKLEEFLEHNSKLFCELCKFNFLESSHF